MAKRIKKEKKIRITADSICKAIGVESEKEHILPFGEGENIVEVSVKPRLSLTERSSMIQDIVSMVFLEDQNGCTIYRPEFKRFAFDYEIVNYFTDIAMPVDGNKAWEFLERTDIASLVRENVCNDCISLIIYEANEAIEYRKNEILKQSKLDKVINGFIDLFASIQNKAEGFDLNQIINYVQKNAPELKEKLDVLLKNDIAEASAD